MGAAADLLFACAAVPDYLMALMASNHIMLENVGPKVLDSVCFGIPLIVDTGLFASSIVALHMSLSFCATLFRKPIALTILRKVLIAVWPLAIVLSTVELISVNIYWNPNLGCLRHNADAIAFGVEVSCVASSLLMYLVCLIVLACSDTFGQSVQKKIWARAQFYVAAWLTCHLLNTVRVAHMGGFLYNRWMHLVTLALVSLSGLANTLVYAVQSGYMRRLENRSASATISLADHDRDSFLVSIGVAQVVDCSVATSELTSEEELSGSFSVA